MNTSDLLEQLLRGQASQQTGAASPKGGIGGDLGGLLGGLLGGGRAGSSMGGGGLGGLLGGLLGGGSALGGANQNRSGRSGAMNYAALASLGMMAFQAYQAWQRNQASSVPQQAPQTVNLLAGPEVEEHSHAILRALIAAAKADGRIDPAEHEMISTEIGRHTDDPQLQQWLDNEVSRPLDAADVAQSATDPGIAAEMYLASVMLVDDQQDVERAYLDELAAALSIDPQLQVHLEQQAKGTA
ncbi:tellurite resistance TerB family protein [Pseudomonas gregormendelii]|uniref:Tellurite resistance TerB family protein n=1 Tax=Pseudomonas gregormendelii TaxID=1628277 RepID=A0ABS3AEC5_9PSED|nr:tellurite resistance TerB family protein [Pseudomonas gregormendelii]MBN3965186.1 tellurite resistance TerB family protein [Pseudomonas gregormendelii]